MASQRENSFGHALNSNNAWATYKAHQNPQFFPNLAKGQQPEILWLGCSDSRCPETTILGLQPGDVFVHRNIANIIQPNDINTLSVIQYAVDHLHVKHVVLCGHTACGGAKAALGDGPVGGVLDIWISPLKVARYLNQKELDSIKDEGAKIKRMAELNVEAGVKVLMEDATIAKAIREKGLEVHGCIFDLASGKIVNRMIGTDTGKSKPGFAAGPSGVSGGDEIVRGKHAQLVFRDGTAESHVVG